MISYPPRGETMDRWEPPVELTKQEQMIMMRLGRVRTLFGFLRLNRHKIFDDALQEQLESMYRQTGAGDEPHAPAMLCMVLLLQGYMGTSDADAVELAVMDRRWQMVLDCLGADEPPFSQGALQAFRERMVEHDMDRLLVERTAALVRDGVATKGEGQSLSKAVRVAIDSRPLAGAGRVEDTINLSATRPGTSCKSCRRSPSARWKRSAARQASRCSSRRASRLGSTSTGATLGRRRRRSRSLNNRWDR